MRVFGTSRSWPSAGAFAVLLALLLRFAVPNGYMLAGDGSLSIVPCPSVGAVPALALPADRPAPATDMAGMAGMMHGDHAMAMARANGGPSQDRHPAKQQDTVCPYAAVSAPVLPPQPPQLPVAIRSPFSQPIPPAIVSQGVVPLAAPPPPSRGPPSIA